MAETLVTKTVEVASGGTAALPFHLDGATSYYYPLVHDVATELGGCSVYSFAPFAASTNATSIKATPGQVYGFSLFSINTAPVYLAFYNVAAAPTPGTTAIKFVVGLAQSTSSTGQRAYEWYDKGIVFDVGIAVACFEVMPTGTAVALDTAPTVVGSIFYK